MLKFSRSVVRGNWRKINNKYGLLTLSYNTSCKQTFVVAKAAILLYSSSRQQSVPGLAKATFVCNVELLTECVRERTKKRTDYSWQAKQNTSVFRTSYINLLLDAAGKQHKCRQLHVVTASIRKASPPLAQSIYRQPSFLKSSDFANKANSFYRSPGEEYYSMHLQVIRSQNSFSLKEVN